MPYDTNAELPPGVRHALPSHAQDIYREAFNRAWEDYADPARRRPGAGREETAHRVAWAAVKKRYAKRGGRWVPRD
ncbi:MAG: ChaB family protein [Rhodospirillaceae bacterium]|nr:ChaB family protein [Rhodospirillaceae bacterium]